MIKLDEQGRALVIGLIARVASKAMPEAICRAAIALQKQDDWAREVGLGLAGMKAPVFVDINRESMDNMIKELVASHKNDDNGIWHLNEEFVEKIVIKAVVGQITSKVEQIDQALANPDESYDGTAAIAKSLGVSVETYKGKQEDYMKIKAQVDAITGEGKDTENAKEVEMPKENNPDDLTYKFGHQNKPRFNIPGNN